MFISGIAALAMHTAFVVFTLAFACLGFADWNKRRRRRGLIITALFGVMCIGLSAHEVFVILERERLRSLTTGTVEFVEVGDKQFTDAAQVARLIAAIRSAEWCYGPNIGPESLAFVIKVRGEPDMFYTVQASSHGAGAVLRSAEREHRGLHIKGGIFFLPDLDSVLTGLGAPLPGR